MFRYQRCSAPSELLCADLQSIYGSCLIYVSAGVVKKNIINRRMLKRSPDRKIGLLPVSI